jgi:hypothetical protein
VSIVLQIFFQQAATERRYVMRRINPDLHADGYVYERTNSVTAFLPAGRDVHPILRALAEAGCASGAIDVFLGVEGAAILDLEGDKHGAWVRFWRGLENAMADEAEVYQRAEKVLESGGRMVAVFTDGDASRKNRAVEILKTHDGNEVTFWGNTIERL